VAPLTKLKSVASRPVASGGHDKKKPVAFSEPLVEAPG
jgi:hypothetical protein